MKQDASSTNDGSAVMPKEETCNVDMSERGTPCGGPAKYRGLGWMSESRWCAEHLPKSMVVGKDVAEIVGSWTIAGLDPTPAERVYEREMLGTVPELPPAVGCGAIRCVETAIYKTADNGFPVCAKHAAAIGRLKMIPIGETLPKSAPAINDSRKAGFLADAATVSHPFSARETAAIEGYSKAPAVYPNMFGEGIHGVESEPNRVRMDDAGAFNPQLEEKLKAPDYDRSIHTNPDARAWAELFVKTVRAVAAKDVDRMHFLLSSQRIGEIVTNQGYMIGWFANAMMAMHDHLQQRDSPLPVVGVVPRGTPVNLRIPEELSVIVHESIGEASMCWDPLPGNQVFDSTKALRIAENLCERVGDALDDAEGLRIYDTLTVAAAFVIGGIGGVLIALFVISRL